MSRKYLAVVFLIYPIFIYINSCSYTSSYTLTDYDLIREAAVRHYIEETQKFYSDSLILSIDKQNPTDKLIEELNDSELYFIKKDEYGVPKHYHSDRYYPFHLSIDNVHWIELKEVRVSISSFWPPHSIYSVDYFLKKIDCKWVVTAQSVEEMS